jgi:hypothetical protein
MKSRAKSASLQMPLLNRAGNKTLTAIAEELNAAGVTPARSGQDRYSAAKWYACVLTNEQAYRGGTRGASDVRWQAIL